MTSNERTDRRERRGDVARHAGSRIDHRQMIALGVRVAGDDAAIVQAEPDELEPENK